MRSALYTGHVGHDRPGKGRNRFRYPVSFAALDVDELAPLAARSRVFSHNRMNLFSLMDRDYAGADRVGLRASIEAFLGQADRHPGRIASITLITQLRALGYVFNPVSFFLCRDQNDALVSTVAEVTNTYGQRHRYVLDAETRLPGQDCTYRTEKSLYVSPFLPPELSYEWDLRGAAVPDADRLRIAMTVTPVDRPDRPALRAWMTGQRKPMTDGVLTASLIRYALMPQRIIGLIHWQALKLRALGHDYRQPPS